jgi:hypothetical protein
MKTRIQIVGSMEAGVIENIARRVFDILREIWGELKANEEVDVSGIPMKTEGTTVNVISADKGIRDSLCNALKRLNLAIENLVIAPRMPRSK